MAICLSAVGALTRGSRDHEATASAALFDFRKCKVNPTAPVGSVVVVSRLDATKLQAIVTDPKPRVAVPPLPTNGGVSATTAGQTATITHLNWDNRTAN